MKSSLLPAAGVLLASHGCAVALAVWALTPGAQAANPTPRDTSSGINTTYGLNAGANLDTRSAYDVTAVGYNALQATVASASNTAIGANALSDDTDGYNNTAVGESALNSNTTADNNTAVGFQALDDSTGSDNTALGSAALRYNETGSDNVAVGSGALLINVSGGSNVAIGYRSLNNTTGSGNTATGYEALYNNNVGTDNTASGIQALYCNTQGYLNTADGFDALYNNTTGSGNTASGYEALYSNTTGSNNIAVGHAAGSSVTTGSFNINIGHVGSAGQTHTIRLGTEGTQKNAFIAGVSGVTVAGGVPVVIDTNGHLGTKTSSARFKEAITPMDKASEAIFHLEPVSFRYKPELDPAGAAQFGLVAEQVEKVDPDLVARDADGKVYTVRYDEVNAMLLNEFLKERCKVEAQQQTVAAQQDTIAQLRADLDAQRKEVQDLAALVRARPVLPAP